MQIVLDTDAVRVLGYPDGAPVYEALVGVARAGHQLKLGDHSVAELMTAIEERRFGWREWEQARDRMEEILFVADPISAAGWELFAQMGLDVGRVIDPRDLSVRRFERLACWKKMLLDRNPTEFRTSRILEVAGRRTEISLRRGAASELMGGLRSDWIEALDEIVTKAAGEGERAPEDLVQDVASGLDEGAGWKDVPPSVRLDALIRVKVHYVLRRLKSEEPYNPTTKKHRNDGIDYDALQYLGVPAVLCTIDTNLRSVVRQAGSLQADWVMTPVELAAANRSGRLSALPGWTDIQNANRDRSSAEPRQLNHGRE
jgi:hypothetical protein